ncbi:Mediator of RNA polymerase II transcription subunit 4 [Holothuria leucospilota]|uniref:Mediator of RNA polymerase II transcription subunit 4 n=1 Tax=Holothuria leucospilota TaxID=206669 RepID=A0A9Q1H3K6_HOLLE|nr:Mediator of RNA polymerase II transcription subunit 4 [Holothuria leucospilota]
MATSSEKIASKSKLLSLVEEAEQLTRDLLETTTTARQKIVHPDDPQIMEMLLKKNEELEATLKETEVHREKKKEIECLQEEVDKRDEDIKQLQKQLKEAEHVLSTALYQAKEKLKAIGRANKGALSVEQLIKYAHRISATNSVAAPLTWAPGDPRRPYPTDLEIRMGILSRLNNLPGGGSGVNQEGDQNAGSAETWQPSSELTVSLNLSSGISNTNGKGFDLGQNKENEDVDVMSSDSESSSSSGSP